MQLSYTLPRTALAATLYRAPAVAHDLEIEIDVPCERGLVLAALYGSAETWLDESRAVRRVQQPARSKTTIVYRDLPPGRYAISAFLDANQNGRLDYTARGLPVEPYGFSRNARRRVGPPSFAEAVIDLRSDTRLRLQLR